MRDGNAAWETGRRKDSLGKSERPVRRERQDGFKTRGRGGRATGVSGAHGLNGGGKGGMREGRRIISRWREGEEGRDDGRRNGNARGWKRNSEMKRDRRKETAEAGVGARETR